MDLNQAKYSNRTSSALIKTGSGTLYGFIVNSHTSGTLKLWDNTSAASTVIMNTFSFPTGSSVQLLPMGVSFYTGLYATIGGTADITLLYT